MKKNDLRSLNPPNEHVEAEKYIKTKFNDESSDAGEFTYPVDLNGPVAGNRISPRCLRKKHLYFFDGTSGGYTQAATQIKDKLRKKAEKEVH